MSTPILATKLYIPSPRAKVVSRHRLFERLNNSLSSSRKLTIISAPAGFGKTTLVSEWVAALTLAPLPVGEGLGVRVAWLSLDEDDNDPARFLTYLVTALQTISPNIGNGVLGMLQSPQPPPTESILTTLLNEITTILDNFILVLDDYHLIDAKPIDNALTFLLRHLPPQMHLVITTREDPQLPLARLRSRDQLTELRVADLRFTSSEAAEFINQIMGLNLSAEDIAALEARTEGWIAGLQLAAISMQGHHDTTNFIKSFTGTHHFVLDYLVEEVLHQQPENIQKFLLQTSILDRMCGPLCDAVLLNPSSSAQETLEYIGQANLFIVPLDNERQWYRYHHLFADLLRQRLHQSSASTGGAAGGVSELHIRASQWYEDNGLELEAFHHAATGNDIERAERLIEGKGIPLTFRGASVPVMNWLESLPKTVLDAKPPLWVMYASTLLFSGKNTAVEQKLQAAEAALAAALQSTEPDEKSQDLIGRIASMRATLAVIQHDAETIIAQSRRALKYLHPNNLPVRTATTWTLGYAYQLQGDRAAASQAYAEVISIGESFGKSIYTLAATINLGQIQEANNQLNLAAESYRRSLQLAGDPPQRMVCEAYLGLARITYEWNDLEAAAQYGQQSAQLAQQLIVDTFAAYGVFVARMRLAQGDVSGAVAVLSEAEEFVRQHNFAFRMPDVVAAQVLTLLRQGDLPAASHLAQKHKLPISRARVHLAQGDPSAALSVLEPLRQQVDAKGWQDERLKVTILQSIAHHANKEKDKAMQLLGDALELAESGGFIRIFVDEGSLMAQLLSEAATRGIKPGYIGKLLAVFEAGKQKSEDKSSLPSTSSGQPLIEPLSQRELEVLKLIAQGLSNREISKLLFLALNTVKGHNRLIFGKLQVQRRTEAVARARELDLL
ncbi:MAG: LuxR family transcriptional regulator [Anaerolineales bacterium]|nr:LuxR family transcriptional regulator [Anaerolineales bacterium]